ncbi:hypothetical protein D3C87_1366620 [compost metagenome]
MTPLTITLASAAVWMEVSASPEFVGFTSKKSLQDVTEKDIKMHEAINNFLIFLNLIG